MKKVVIFLLVAVHSEILSAQCAMCKMVAENSTAEDISKAEGVNAGIMYLLFSPYLALFVIGFIWYKKYNRENAQEPNTLVDNT